MARDCVFGGAGAAFEDSGYLTQWEGGEEGFGDSLVEFTPYGDGYEGFAETKSVGVEHALGDSFEEQGGFGDALDSAPLLASLRADLASEGEAAGEGLGDDSAVSLSNSLDDVGAIILKNRFCDPPPSSMTTTSYAPHSAVLAAEPEATPDPTALYEPLTTLHFRTSADAKAHRRRARLPPKSDAPDVARVKRYGREYWVRRIYNAMIDIRSITDGDSSIHRTRFAQTRAFDALDLEAAAHHVFEQAVAVHERGWSRPVVYHKKVVRGKMVDLSRHSLEMRLSRICVCLQQKKSSVDDAMRGGVTLALLCDNPEARSFTKVSNDVGNKKRGERLRATSIKGKARKTQAQQLEVVVEADSAEDEDGREE